MGIRPFDVLKKFLYTFSNVQRLVILVFATITILFFQNCSQSPLSFIKVNSRDEKSLSADNTGGGGIGGNGGGVEGKPISTYVRLTPNKYCDKNNLKFSEINFYPDKIILNQQDVIDCKIKSIELKKSDIVQSSIQNQIISYLDGVYWSVESVDSVKKSNLNSILNNNNTLEILPEIWCQNTSPVKLNSPLIAESKNEQSEPIELVVFRSDKVQYSNESARTISDTKFSLILLKNQNPLGTFNWSAVKSNQIGSIQYQQDNISLNIQTANLTLNQPGHFQANAIIKQNNIKLNCITAGHMDSIAWPTPLKLIHKLDQVQFLSLSPGLIASSSKWIENPFNESNSVLKNESNTNSDIDNIFYFNWLNNTYSQIFQANSNLNFKSKISGFKVSSTEDKLVFRSNLLAELNFELFGLSLSSPSQFQHIGNSLVNNRNWNLNTNSDFYFSNDGKYLFFKDNSHLLTETSTDLMQRGLDVNSGNNINGTYHSFEHLYKFDLITKKMVSLNLELLPLFKGTTVKDFYNLNDSVQLARIGAANYSLNVNGSNDFYLIRPNINDDNHPIISKLNIDLSIYKTNSSSLSSSTLWIPDYFSNVPQDMVMNSRIIINPENSKFLFVAGSWDNNIHWIQFDFEKNQTLALPINFIPIKFMDENNIAGLCNQTKDDWIRKSVESPVFNCIWNSQSDQTMLIKNNAIFLSYSKDDQIINWLASDTVMDLTNFCEYSFQTQQTNCSKLIAPAFVNVTKLKYSINKSKILFLADKNNDSRMELYVHYLNGINKTEILSDQFMDFGGVIDYAESPNTNSVLFYSKDPATNLNYLFEYKFH